MSTETNYTEAQRALASRLQHLFNSGHPKHAEAECLRVIAEHDTVKDAQVSRLTDELCELRPLCLEHRDAHDAVMAQLDALISAGTELSKCANAARYVSETMKDDESSGLINLRIAAWQSAVTGASEGRKAGE